MGKSTHPFVQKMNLAKAVHRAMRAGEEKPKPPIKREPGLTATLPGDTSYTAIPAKRTVTLTKKPPAPVKGVLTALPIEPKDAA